MSMEQFASNLYVESVPSGGKRKGKNTDGESSKKKKPKTMQTMTRVGQDFNESVVDSGYAPYVADSVPFNPEEFLSQIPLPSSPVKKVTVTQTPKRKNKKEIEQCPVCAVDLNRGVAKRKDGGKWKYVRCPSTRNGVKCFITCGADEVHEYVARVKSNLHPIYRSFDPERFICSCDNALVLATSKSEKNPNRLYFKCAKRECNYFQWADETPDGEAEEILNPEASCE